MIGGLFTGISEELRRRALTPRRRRAEIAYIGFAA
jgi:hypothetical protein